jgi:hypothetical protein
VLQKLDFALLAQQFEQWAKDNVEMELGEWVATGQTHLNSECLM